MLIYLFDILTDSTAAISLWTIKKSYKYIVNNYTSSNYKSTSEKILDEIKKQNIELEELKLEIKLLKNPDEKFDFTII